MIEVTFQVEGWPPAKNEATSMLAAGHPHANRVTQLLEAARDAMDQSLQTLFPNEHLALEMTLESPSPPPADATNFLGGVGDVLENKGHRGALEHLGAHVNVAVYSNDRQIQEIHYRWRRAPTIRYRIRIAPIE